MGMTCWVGLCDAEVSVGTRPLPAQFYAPMCGASAAGHTSCMQVLLSFVRAPEPRQHQVSSYSLVEAEDLRLCVGGHRVPSAT
eukprot:358961-Chlamydomonas_euryale.AAC.18